MLILFIQQLMKYKRKSLLPPRGEILKEHRERKMHLFLPTHFQSQTLSFLNALKKKKKLKALQIEKC